MGRIAIYPGTFDPVTYGHIDIVKRASQIFDEVIIAIAHNPHKNPLFTLEERIDMVEKTVAVVCEGVTVDNFEGLVVKYAQRKGVNVLIRGLRMVSDFEYEFQMALTNRRLSEEIETVFLMPSESYSFLSSALIKEAVSLGGETESFVPTYVAGKLKDKLNKK